MVYNNTYVTLLIWKNNVLSSLKEGNNIIQNNNTNREKNKIIKMKMKQWRENRIYIKITFEAVYGSQVKLDLMLTVNWPVQLVEP